MIKTIEEMKNKIAELDDKEIIVTKEEAKMLRSMKIKIEFILDRREMAMWRGEIK